MTCCLLLSPGEAPAAAGGALTAAEQAAGRNQRQGQPAPAVPVNRGAAACSKEAGESQFQAARSKEHTRSSADVPCWQRVCLLSCAHLRAEQSVFN
jgi:hypothetical protein